jgi:hypothetical protein
VTTLARDVIVQAEDWTDDEIPWRRAAAAGFSPTKERLAAYDRGEFCYAAFPDSPHFGLAVISERYVRRVWSRSFRVLGFGQHDPDPRLQPVIVCMRP